MYDVIIIGAGAAGLCAGIYCARRELKTLIIEKGIIGGTMQQSEDIDNYPGFGKATGGEISKKMEAHARRLGVEFELDEIVEMDLKTETKILKSRKQQWESKAVILAMGATPKRLGVPGEKEFSGKGVSYCATCDAPFFKDRIVAVVGGGSTAVEDATYLSKIAKKVYIIHRRDEFRAEKMEVKKMIDAGVQPILKSNLKEIHGDKMVNAITVSTPEGDKKLEMNGVFVLVGTTPNSTLAKTAGVELTEKGFINVDKKMKTNLPGVFACGDITGGIEQIVTAVGEGCYAALSVYAYVEKPYWAK